MAGEAIPEEEAANLVRKLLDNSTRQLEQKKREVELESQKDRNRFEFSKIALKTQSEDLEKEREHKRKQSAANKVFAGFILLSVLGFLWYALNSGHEDVALEIIKAAVWMAGGGAGGYALGIRKVQRADLQDNSDR